MRQCSRCKRSLPDEEFGASLSRCKRCNRAVAAEWYEKEHGTAGQRKLEQEKLLRYIKKLRSEGHTLKDIAERIGLDKSSISYYLSEKRRVGTHAVKKFKMRLGLQ